MNFEEAREVIDYVLEKTADMSRPAFYATMGTILKIVFSSEGYSDD